MYAPAHFREERIPVLHEAIRRIGLANLVTLGPEGLTATAVPVLLDSEPGPNGALVGHVSRGNPQWRGVAPGAQALAILMGPDAYVSPSWYATKAETGKVVPTWNYVAVHAHGPIEFFDDPDRLLAVVERLTATHEAGKAVPWSVEDAPREYIQGLLKGIVGFRMPIARLEGSWKMSQNRVPQDRVGVAEGLTREGDAADRAVADLVRTANPVE